MAVVGSAIVVVRVITSHIGDDIRNALDDAARRAAPAGNRLGDNIGNNIRNGIRGGLGPLPDEGERAGEQSGQGFVRGWIRSLGGVLGNSRSRLPPPGEEGRSEDRGENVGTKFVKGFLKGIAKIPTKLFLGLLVLPALGAAVNAVAYAASSLVAIVGYIGPAFAAAAGAGVAGMTAMLQATAVLKLAFTKVGKKGTAEFQAMNKAITTFKNTLALTVQHQAIPRFQEALGIITTKLMPTLRKQLGGTAKVLGDLAIGFAKVATRSDNVNRINKIMRVNNVVIKNAGTAATYLFDAFLHVLLAAQPLVVELSKLGVGVAKAVAHFVHVKAASGDLANFFTQSADKIKQLVQIIIAFGRGIGNVFKVAGLFGGDLLDSIQKVADKFFLWTDSVAGQDSIREFFEDAIPIVHELAGLIADIGRIWGESFSGANTSGTVDFIKSLRENFVPALDTMYQSIKDSGPSLAELTTSLATLISQMAESGALGSFTSTLKVLLDVIAELLSMPIVGTVLGWSLAFAGMAKAVNLVTFGGFNAAVGLAADGVQNLFRHLNREGGALTGFKARMASLAQGVKRGFSEMTDRLKIWAINMKNSLRAGFAAGAAKLRVAMTRLGGAVRGVASAFRAFAVSLLTNPIFLIIAGIIALGAVLFIAYKKFKPFRDIVDSTFRILKTGAKATLDAVVGAFKAIGAAIMGAVNAIKSVVTGLFHWFTDSPIAAIILGPWRIAFGALRALFTGGISGLIDYFKGLLSALVHLLAKVFDILTTPYRLAWNWIKKNVIDKIADAFKSLVSGIASAVSTVWDTITKPFKDAWDWISANVVTPLLHLFDQLPGAISSALSTLWNIIITPFITAWNWIQTNVAQPLHRVFWALPGAITTALSALLTIIITPFQKAWNWIKTNVGTPIRSVFSALPGALTSALSRVWSIITTPFVTAYEKVKGIVGDIVSFIGSIPSKILGFVGAMASAGRDFIGGLWDGMKNAASGALGWAGDMASSIITAIKNGINNILNLPWVIEFDVNFPAPVPDYHFGPKTILPAFAKGAFVTGPTVGMFGEKGNEWVLPDDKLRQVIKEATGANNVTVQVFIGERELTDIVNTQVKVINSNLASDILAGRRGQL